MTYQMSEEEFRAIHLRIDLHEYRLRALKETLDQMAPPSVETCTRKPGHEGPCNGYPYIGCPVFVEEDSFADPAAGAPLHQSDLILNADETVTLLDEFVRVKLDLIHHGVKALNPDYSEFAINVEKSFDEVNEKLIRILARFDEPTPSSTPNLDALYPLVTAPEPVHFSYSGGGVSVSKEEFEKVAVAVPDSRIANAITNYITPLIQNIESAKKGYLDLSDSTLLHSLEAWHSVLRKLRTHLQPATPGHMLVDDEIADLFECLEGPAAKPKRCGHWMAYSEEVCDLVVGHIGDCRS